MQYWGYIPRANLSPGVAAGTNAIHEPAMIYRREIDGLRAVAVLPVILFHAGFPLFSGGYVGVDVFFVISGYLITSIIINERAAGAFSILNFYERRARRILPALFVVMAAALPFAWRWLLPIDLKDFSQSLVAVSAFASNALFFHKSGYFDQAAQLRPLLHTWSLALEEQFYILFPALLLLAWRLGRPRVVAILIVGALASLSIAQWGAYEHPAATFYLLHTRAWELIIGCVIAFYLSRPERSDAAGPIGNPGSQWLSGLGLALILYAVFRFDEQTPDPSVYTLMPTIGTALIILFATPQTLVGRLLGAEILVGLGLISYSAYLWHHPIFAFAKYQSADAVSPYLMVFFSALSVALAFVTWKYVERPFRDRRRFTRRQIFTYAGAGAVAFSSLGLVGHFGKGLAWRLTPDQQRVLSFQEYAFKDVLRSGTCFLTLTQPYTDFASECGRAPQSGGTLIWGDSHAAAFSYGLRQVRRNLSQYTAGDCPPFHDFDTHLNVHCRQINTFVAAKVKEIQPEEIFLDANWYGYPDVRPEQHLIPTIRYIRSLSPNSRITIVGQAPVWPKALPVMLFTAGATLADGRRLRNPLFPSLAEIDLVLARVAHESGVQFIRPLSALCQDGQCVAATIASGVVMPTTWDTDHLTAGGSTLVTQALIHSESGPH